MAKQIRAAFEIEIFACKLTRAHARAICINCICPKNKHF